MKFMIYLVVLFLVLNIMNANKVAMANSLIQDSCKKASKFEEPHYYNLCITSIKQNPESQKARNIDELTVIGVKNAISNMTNVKGIVEKILKERKYKSRLSEKLLRDCSKLYSEGNDFLTKSLKYINSRNYQEVDNSIAKAGTVPRTCEMGFNGDNNQTSPVTKDNDVLFEVVTIPRSFNHDAHIVPRIA
ncbi:unnamed protein product [Microthlaspi erraticum]|uniref:Pectinesterase inhibitor domain-containing protein n=1 Tax=Microthlaspi erraticum TaxID=1685480 RepID=A0A6D2KFI2_9BRAS|nr:unnamed protein product [Microthlaspi erraticum]